MRRLLAATALLFALPAAAAGGRALTLDSPAFSDHGPLPTRFTCAGAGISPPLEWHGAPPGTRGYALIVTDPDAPNPMRPPTHTFVHWVVAYLPADIQSLAAGQSSALPQGSRVSENSTGHRRYTPPCPPAGRHRYIFTLYALDSASRLAPPDADRAAVLKAIAPHVLARAQLIGTYQKPH